MLQLNNTKHEKRAATTGNQLFKFVSYNGRV